jgi:hypothetical protein
MNSGHPVIRDTVVKSLYQNSSAIRFRRKFKVGQHWQKRDLSSRHNPHGEVPRSRCEDRVPQRFCLMSQHGATGSPGSRNAGPRIIRQTNGILTAKLVHLICRFSRTGYRVFWALQYHHWEEYSVSRNATTSPENSFPAPSARSAIVRRSSRGTLY